MGNVRGMALSVVVVALVGAGATIPTLRMIHHELAALPPAKSPDFLRVVSGTDAHGRPLEFEIAESAVLVVVSRECNHCLKQLREFRALYDGDIFRRYGVTLIVLSLQSGDVPSFEDIADGERVHLAFDSGGSFFMETFGSSGLPVVAYIKSSGCVAYQRSGFRTGDLDRELIRRVFGS